MTFQPAINAAEVVMNFTCDGKNLANVVNVLYPTAYNQTDLDTLAAGVDLLVSTDYLPWIHTGVNFDSVTVRGLTSQTDLESTSSVHNGPGTAVGDPLPNNVTLCFRLGTGHTGRSSRGRFYAMPTIQSQLDSANTFSQVYADGIVDWLAALQAEIINDGATLVVLSRYHNNARRTTAQFLNVISIDYRNREVDSQRGRLPVGH